ncbi:MAG: septation protein SpoVG family protein [Elusimicrobiota bacterium]
MFVISFAGSLFGQSQITDLKVVPINDLTYGVKAKAELTFNQALKIKDVLLIQAGEQLALKFPTYISNQGKEYPQIVILQRKNYQEVLAAISEEKQPTPTGTRELNYRISQFSPTRNWSKVKVLATVVFDDWLQISCKIIQSKTGRLWVAWPAEQRKQNRWLKQVIFIDKKLQKSIEKELLHKYRLRGE